MDDSCTTRAGSRFSVPVALPLSMSWRPMSALLLPALLVLLLSAARE
jgi:hypothetical protein